jgi:hypothetical protein
MKRFAMVFLVGFLLFALANFISYFVRSDDPDDADSRERYGFPFLISSQIPQASGGVTCYPKGPYQYFSRNALWTDLSIAVVTSGFAAAIYSMVSCKMAQRTKTEGLV